MLRVRLFILAFFIIPSVFKVGFSKGDVTWRQMQRTYFKPLGIKDEYNPYSFKKLTEHYQFLIHQIKTNGSYPSPTGAVQKKRDVEKALEWLEFGLKDLKESEQKKSKLSMTVSYNHGRQMLYSLLSESFEGRMFQFDEVFRLLGRFITRFPHATADQLKQQSATENEAFPLAHSDSPNHIINPKSLKNLNAYQVAMLDVPGDHRIWYTRKEIRCKTDPAEEFFMNVEEALDEALKTSSTNINQRPYSFDEAKKVVFFKKASLGKSRGANPKAKVVDSFGIHWKLKWGPESYTESVANYLYLSLGGKHQDVNFSIGHQNPLLLVFDYENPKLNYASSDPCDKITDADKMVKCFKRSQYRVDLSPFILEKGTITKRNIATLLESTNVENKQLIGKSYAKISQASLELREKKHIFNRMGSMPQSTLGSENDRAIRGLIAFNVFLDNFDSKDSNGEGLLSPIGPEEIQYYESPTDLGGGFRGSYLRKKGINGFKESGSLYVLDPFNRGGRYYYTEMMAYRPKSAKLATASDIYWMVEKIATLLTDQKIETAVEQSQLPDFVQKAWRYKLQSRRNRFAKLAGIQLPSGCQSNERPNLSIPLRDSREVAMAANLYGIPEKTLQAAITNAGLKGAGYIDHPLIDGKISNPKKSLIVNLLENLYYPVGLGSKPAFQKANYSTPRKFRGP